MANPVPRGTRVLVIDDSSTVRASAAQFLTQGGYEVVIARNGFEALARIEQDRPDLILVDILMPRLDGYQTCALLRRNRRHGFTPIVMLSSKDSAFDRARGRLVGALDHLSKPFTKAQLLQAVAAQLSGREGPSLDFCRPAPEPLRRDLRTA